MPEEKPVNVQKDEDVWKDIDDLLAEANAVHFVEAKFRNKKVKVAWKELSDEEVASKALIIEDFRKLGKDEQNKVMTDWLDKDILAKIAKAGKQEGCLNNNEITEEIWKKLPSRIRTSLTVDVLETRDEIMRNFQ